MSKFAETKTHILTAIPPALESKITSGDSLPKTVEFPKPLTGEGRKL